MTRLPFPPDYQAPDPFEVARVRRRERVARRVQLALLSSIAALALSGVGLWVLS